MYWTLPFSLRLDRSNWKIFDLLFTIASAESIYKPLHWHEESWLLWPFSPQPLPKTSNDLLQLLRMSQNCLQNNNHHNQAFSFSCITLIIKKQATSIMQIHIEVVVIFLRMYRAHMNVLFTNDHIGPTKPPPPAANYKDYWPTIINKCWARNSISFKHLDFLCPFLDVNLTTHHSNIGVWVR